jgi:hypothetical protein
MNEYVAYALLNDYVTTIHPYKAKNDKFNNYSSLYTSQLVKLQTDLHIL